PSLSARYPAFAYALFCWKPDSMLARSYSLRAVSSRRRHEVTVGRLRSSARRSRSVIPPHTPNSTRLSRASARHSVRTGHPVQTAFALFCAAPWTNSSSGSLPRHAACVVQSVTQLMLAPSSPESRLPHGGNGMSAAATRDVTEERYG